jgi:tryptophanyl-tRNA synthetase
MKTNINTKKIRVLSGIRASNNSLHIGNLLGAIDGMVALQNDPKYETFFMVADLHGITEEFDPKELADNRLAVAKDFVAAGIDPSKSTLFLQSDVPEHAELAYYLASTINVNRLLRMPSKKNEYKKYSDQNQLSNISYALLGYPVLMAADILLYKAVEVPIGEDQEPNLEVAREIARSLNSRYGLNFPVPKKYTSLAESITVPSINGKGKMSKSKYGSAIFLDDSRDQIESKVMKIPTDTGKGSEVPRPGQRVYALFLLVELFLGKSRKIELEKQYISEGVEYGRVKKELADAIYRRIEPIQRKRADLDRDPEEIERILKSGAARASQVAKLTLEEVRNAMGMPQI